MKDSNSFCQNIRCKPKKLIKMCKTTTFKQFYANLLMEADHGCSYDALLVN